VLETQFYVFTALKKPSVGRPLKKKKETPLSLEKNLNNAFSFIKKTLIF